MALLPKFYYFFFLPFMKTVLKTLALSCLLAFGAFSSYGADKPSAAASPTFPKGWGGGGKNYDFQIDRQIKRTGNGSATIKFIGPDSSGFGSMTQCIDPSKFLGKRVRWSGYIKAADAGKASLWMRVDGKDPKAESLSFDNMQDGREIRGTQEWKKCEVVLNISKEAKGICLGILLSGKGQLWADDLQIEIVGKDVPATEMLPRALPQSPINLNFEE
jgi:hypothetical protein